MKSKKILFIDRDGTLVKEPPIDYQLDSLEKLSFVPGVMKNLGFIAEKLDFFFAMVSNQDGLGTASFPEETFWPAHNLMMETLEGEGITWDAVHIDPTMPEDNASTRKPEVGMLKEYIANPAYDLAGSFVIGDRLSDMKLAQNLGCKGILLVADGRTRNDALQEMKQAKLEGVVVLIAMDWAEIVPFLFAGERTASCHRVTKETSIDVSINLDGQGESSISTGLHFFDHMLEQIAKHGGVTLNVDVHGDLEVDEHHTIEDTAIAIGTCIKEALGDKRGIERYGYSLPMDDCQAHVLIDFGGRSWLIWDAEFQREYVGDMPTEMFLHFFKSLSDAALMNLNIRAEGENEHHKIEGIFKAFARAIKMAIRRDIYRFELPSTKGIL
ncbi:MAG: bifunctional histidinol-phosphatase/imidazoleglycerol-phosphate dehydratase HisB [Bacteroidaceae bacterium]